MEKQQLRRYVATDLNRYGLNKHGFLSDQNWTNDEALATFWASKETALLQSECMGAKTPHCIRVAYVLGQLSF